MLWEEDIKKEERSIFILWNTD